MSKQRWLTGALVALVSTTVPAAAQEAEGPAAAVAADVISAILEGQAGEGAWNELEAALGGVSGTSFEAPAYEASLVGTERVESVPIEAEPVEAEMGTVPPPPVLEWIAGAASTVGQAVSATLAGVTWSLELVGMSVIALLLGVATTATMVGSRRRARRPTGIKGRGEVVRLPARRSRRSRRGRSAHHSRDAERLAARLRARTAA